MFTACYAAGLRQVKESCDMIVLPGRTLATGLAIVTLSGQFTNMVGTLKDTERDMH